MNVKCDYKGVEISYDEDDNRWYVDTDNGFESLAAAKRYVDRHTKADFKRFKVISKELNWKGRIDSRTITSITGAKAYSIGPDGREILKKHEWKDYLLDTPAARKAVETYLELVKNNEREEAARERELEHRKAELFKGLDTLALKALTDGTPEDEEDQE